ncbi:MAG: type VI secretion system tube protein Hcp [Gammaproteobacteria bacterium]|nr:type VI secretion system tube protein Hcp [Gammaproteobacteria bacterium]MBI5615180.1 type VI secretion system tube protein Hcp [Gammaproteobacteria bacterium]
MIVMKLDPIKGDCKLEGYADYITLDDVSWDINREPKESAKGATQDLNFGVAEAGAVNLTKTIDMASVDLMRMATGGGASPSQCLIEFIQSGVGGADSGKYKAYLQITLKRPVVKKWGINGSGDDRPSETLEIMYNSIEMKYMSTDDKGKQTTFGPKGWDLVLGKGLG